MGKGTKEKGTFLKENKLFILNKKKEEEGGM